MKVDRLFLHVLDEVEQRVEGPSSEYQMIRMAGLLRLLMLDATPLMDRVNRPDRVKVDFRIRQRFPIRLGLPTSDYHAMMLPLVPRPEGWVGPTLIVNSVSNNTITVTRSSLLARPMVVINHQVVCTVRHVIKFSAHVLGGVHCFEPKDEFEEHLAYVIQEFPAWGDDLSAITRSLAHIGKVVVDGLEPLRDRVRDDIGPC